MGLIPPHLQCYTSEAQHSAEDANVILFKTKKDYEEARPKFKLEAGQAMAILRKHKVSALKQSRIRDTSADKSTVPRYQWYKESYEKLRKVIQIPSVRASSM